MSVQFTFVLFGEEKLREEEGGMVAVARAVDACRPHHLKFLFKMLQ